MKMKTTEKTKTVKMSLKEFMNFRQEAFKEKQSFKCEIQKDCYYAVIAQYSFLKQLGF